MSQDAKQAKAFAESRIFLFLRLRFIFQLGQHTAFHQPKEMKGNQPIYKLIN